MVAGSPRLRMVAREFASRIRLALRKSPHGHVHVVGAGALCERVELVVDIEFILLGQGGCADPIAARTMAGGTCGDTAFRVAGVN